MVRFFRKYFCYLFLGAAVLLCAGCGDVEKADQNVVPPRVFVKAPGDSILASLTCGPQCSQKSRGNIYPVDSNDVQVISGNRPLEEILKIVRKRLPGLRHVYSRWLKKGDDFNGRLVFEIEIDSVGAVARADIKSSTTGMSQFDEDIRTALSRWRFDCRNLWEPCGEIVFEISFQFYIDESVQKQEYKRLPPYRENLSLTPASSMILDSLKKTYEEKAYVTKESKFFFVWRKGSSYTCKDVYATISPVVADVKEIDFFKGNDLTTNKKYEVVPIGKTCQE